MINIRWWFLAPIGWRSCVPIGCSPEVEIALKGVQFIAQHIRNKDKDIEVSVQKNICKNKEF